MITPDEDEIHDEAMALVAEVEELATIGTPAQYARAGELLKGTKALRARIAEMFAPMLDGARRALETIREQRDKVDAQPRAVEAALRTSMAAWDTLQRRAQDEAATAALAKARAEAEARKRADAEAARAAGDVQQAQAIDRRPVVVVAPPVPALATPAVDGIGHSTTWAAEVVDLAALVRAAAAQPDRYLKYLKADGPALNAAARASRGTLNIPGVRPVEKRHTRVQA